MLPHMVVPPPGPRSRALCDELARFESPGVSTMVTGDIPIVWERAKGSNVMDADGNVYVDLTGAFGVASLGHSDRRVTAALGRQARVLQHGLGDVHPHVGRVALARRLAELAPGRNNKVILCSTGAEAVEVAMKTAALYTGRTGLLAFQGAFHGQTYGALAVTSRERFRKPFAGQIFQGVARAPYAYCYRCPIGLTYPGCDTACLGAVRDLLDHPPESVGPIGAVIVEPVQGREGEIVPPPEWLPGLKALCAERGVLLIADEIVTGFGRTGKWFAVEHGNVEPDIMCVGKAMGNGMPISACIAREEVMDDWRFEEGEAPYSSTFMAHPMSCAAALAAIDELERRSLLRRAAKSGAHALRRLRGMKARLPLIGDVRGVGLMVGVELVKDHVAGEPATAEAAQVTRLALEKGVIVLRGGPDGNILSLTPPLVITRMQMDFALDVLESAMNLAGPRN